MSIRLYQSARVGHLIPSMSMFLIALVSGRLRCPNINGYIVIVGLWLFASLWYLSFTLLRYVDFNRVDSMSLNIISYCANVLKYILFLCRLHSLCVFESAMSLCIWF